MPIDSQMLTFLNQGSYTMFFEKYLSVYVIWVKIDALGQIL